MIIINREDLTEEKINNAYREYFKTEYWKKSQTIQEKYNNNFNKYFSAIMKHNSELVTTIDYFKQSLLTDDNFYLRWVENLSDDGIALRKIPTDAVITEFNRRVSTGEIKL